MPERLVAIAINRPSELQRDQVQDLVSKHAEEWWHGFDDLWLVADDRSENEWRDLLGAIFLRGPGGLLALDIGTPATKGWASRATWSDTQLTWLKRWVSGTVEEEEEADDIPF